MGRYSTFILAFVFGLIPVLDAGATTVTVDFEGVNVTTASGPISGAPLDSYLASYGVSLQNVTSGSTVQVNSDVNDPDAPSTDVTSVASSGVNFLEQVGGHPISYDLAFDNVLDSFSFTRIAYYGATSSGIIYPQWSAEAFDSVGNSLGVFAFENVNGVYNSVGNPYPAQTYTLTAAGQIASVRITGDHLGFAGRSGAAIDDLVMTYTASAVPEPGTLIVFGFGLAGLAMTRRVSKRR